MAFALMENVKVSYKILFLFSLIAYMIILFVKSFAETLMIVLLVKDVYKTSARFHALDTLNVCRHKHALVECVH